MEELNYLLGYKDIKIYQKAGQFKFSLDSVLLARFVTINRNIKKVLDIGAGTGAIPLILSTRTTKAIDCIEIQEDVYNLCKKSIEYNSKNKQINIINEDVNEWYKEVETDTYDVITCNPPYFQTSNGNFLNEVLNKKMSRHELSLSVEQIIKIAKKILKNNGNLAIVHRPERLVDIFTYMRSNNIEPKRLQYIYPKINSDANLILIEGRKNGKVGLKILNPLIIHEENNKYTKQVNNYFK